MKSFLHIKAKKIETIISYFDNHLWNVGIQINLSLSYLSTYLGHKSFNETQKYIWMTPIIFEDIKNKMEEYSRFIMDIFGGEKFDEDE